MINSIFLQTVIAAPAQRESAKTLAATDTYGAAMVLIVIGVVFISLIMLYIIFKYVAKIYGMASPKKSVPSQHAGITAEGEISGEVNAAIALALHLYRHQLHDNEDPVITMKRVARTYSPWSSKIYGLTKSSR